MREKRESEREREREREREKERRRGGKERHKEKDTTVPGTRFLRNYSSEVLAAMAEQKGGVTYAEVDG